MYADLETLRDNLADISGVQSCKIGIEAGISPADYPLIRIVPVRFTPGKPYNERTAEISVYFGVDVSESQGLEYVYEELLNLEAEILKTIKSSGGKYIETVTDEDRLDTYKLMFIRFEIEATRPTVS